MQRTAATRTLSGGSFTDLNEDLLGTRRWWRMRRRGDDGCRWEGTEQSLPSASTAATRCSLPDATHRVPPGVSDRPIVFSPEPPASCGNPWSPLFPRQGPKPRATRGRASGPRLYHWKSGTTRSVRVPRGPPDGLSPEAWDNAAHAFGAPDHPR